MRTATGGISQGTARRVLDVVEPLPWSFVGDRLGRVERVDALGARVVGCVATASDRPVDVGGERPARTASRDRVRARVAPSGRGHAAPAPDVKLSYPTPRPVREPTRAITGRTRRGQVRGSG